LAWREERGLLGGRGELCLEGGEVGYRGGREPPVDKRSVRLERLARLEVERLAATAVRASPSTVELTDSRCREEVVEASSWEREEGREERWVEG